MSADGLLNIIRREAGNAVASREFTGTLVVTAYDPSTYAVKGMIMPHEVESGWVRITGDHIGNGYGNLAGPKVGSADDLSGDQFALEFDRGDPNTLIATHRIFSDVDQPPQVQPGEILNQDANGSHVYFRSDKSVEMLHGPSGATVHFDPQGNITHDGKGQNVTVVTSGSGSVSVTSGDQGTLSVNAGKGGLSLAGQTIALTGPATLNGQPIQTA